MLARFNVLLPFTLFLEADEHLQVEEWPEGASRFAVYPPSRASLHHDDIFAPGFDVDQLLEPLKEVAGAQTVRGVVMNGKGVIPANLLRIDLWREAFPRRRA